MQDLSDKKPKRCCSDEEVLARKEEILRTATELFAEHGFSDAITQALADRLQVGKGTIYRHFPSKRDLFLAAADRVMRKMQEKILANIAGVEDGLEQVSRGIMAFLSFFAEHPEYVELLIQERAQFKDRKRPTYFEHREINIQKWKQLYRDLMAAGRLREMPVERITTVVSNVLYGIMVTNFFSGQPAPADVQAREILDIIFLGVLSEPERRRRQGETTSADAATDGGPAAGIRTGTDGPTSEAGISGGGLFGGANGDEATMVDGAVGADDRGDGGGVPAGAVVAGAADPDRRV